MTDAADREGGIVPTARLVPELKVSDFERSLRFYLDLAGFEILYERPEEAFAYLSLEGAELMLDRDGEMWNTGPLEHPRGRGINLQIEVPDAAAAHERFLARGYPIMVPLEERWYRRNDVYVGQKQFLVQDPDGYLLRFGQDLGTRPEPG
jgi:catechol 2,3-dioxygenase-like lactoylglutathione lyase family enzyme